MTSRALVLLCSAGGAAGVLLAATQTWALVPASVIGSITVPASGGRVAPAATALALVAAAGAVVLVTSGRLLRVVVAVLMCLAGVGVVATAVQGAGSISAPGGTTGWPYLSMLGGCLIAASGLVGLIRGRTWPGPSRRYERSAPVAGLDGWDRLSRGDDPTL